MTSSGSLRSDLSCHWRRALQPLLCNKAKKVRLPVNRTCHVAPSTSCVSCCARHLAPVRSHPPDKSTMLHAIRCSHTFAPLCWGRYFAPVMLHPACCTCHVAPVTPRPSCCTCHAAPEMLGPSCRTCQAAPIMLHSLRCYRHTAPAIWRPTCCACITCCACLIAHAVSHLPRCARILTPGMLHSSRLLPTKSAPNISKLHLSVRGRPADPL